MSLNSSNRFAIASWRGLEPSRRVLRYAAAMHALALASCLGATLPWTTLGALTLLLAASGARFLWVWSGVPSTLSLASGGQWRMEAAQGAAADHCLLLPLFVTPWLVIARFRGPTRTRTLLIASDSLPPDSFRRLRVRLLQCAHGRRDRT